MSITPQKFGRVTATGARTGKTVNLTLDAVEMADALARSDPLNLVLIEVDRGKHRSGVLADNDALPSIARGYSADNARA